MRREKQGFTLIELLVVIAIIAILMAILMPALQRVKKQAAATACLSTLKQWSLAFAMYVDDNDGKFFSGEYNGTRTNMGSGIFWRMTLRPYSKDEKMWCCPQATKPPTGTTIPAGLWSTTAWRQPNIQGRDEVGSYGLNGWILNIKASIGAGNRTQGWGRADACPRTGQSRHWGISGVQGANNIPIFSGMWWVDAWPDDPDQPPANGAGPDDTPGTNEMNRVCVDRHTGFVNVLFADWSARKIGLKELWTLKWHRTYRTNGVWTQAGGATSDKWPTWMRHYKDY